MSQDLGGGGAVGGVVLGGIVPEEGQKNEKSERFKEEARDEQNMRLGPHQERLGMETEAERLSQSASPESSLCQRELTSN